MLLDIWTSAFQKAALHRGGPARKAGPDPGDLDNKGSAVQICSDLSHNVESTSPRCPATLVLGTFKKGPEALLRSSKRFAWGICLLPIALLFNGCGDQQDRDITGPGQTTEATESGDQQSQVQGKDQDDDGVRDDIQAVISHLPDSSEQKQAMAQTHKALVKMMEAGSGNEVSPNDAAASLGRAQNCLFSVYGPNLFQQRWEMIRADTFNTDARIRANLAFSKKMSGRVGTLPSGDTCDS